MRELKKIIVLGDIHGRSIWRDIVKAENPDLTLFLGDYVTSRENITEGDQLWNLRGILQYKENHPRKVVLLRGNHDCEAAGYSWAECWPSFKNKQRFPLEKFELLTQWAYQWKDIVFSHAGISRTFLESNGLQISEMTKMLSLDDSRFEFAPGDSYDVYGDSITQTPIWIRPKALLSDMPEGLTQVVGHTPSECITEMKGNHGNSLWICDALKNNKYLCIKDGLFWPRTFKEGRVSLSSEEFNWMINQSFQRNL